MTELDDDQQPVERPVLRWLWLVLAPILAVGAIAFAIGMIAGASDTSDAARGHSSGFYIALALAGSILAGTVWLTLRMLPAYALPRSPRMRQARLLLYVSALMGVAIGAAGRLLQGDDPGGVMDIVTGVEPMPQALAWLMLVGLILSMVLSIRWHRLLDEHERAAYDFGAVAAIYVYSTLSIGWWVLSRAALVPAPDAAVVFFITMACWMLGWLIRRFR